MRTILGTGFRECLLIFKYIFLHIPLRYLNADPSEFSRVNQKASNKLMNFLIIFSIIILVLEIQIHEAKLYN